MRRSPRRLLALSLAAATAGLTAMGATNLASAGAAVRSVKSASVATSPAVTSRTYPNGAAAGLPAGDYKLTVNVASTAGIPMPGEIIQYEGGTGVADRVANFHAATTGTVVTGDVRLTGPSDVVEAVTYGPATVGALTLTAASWGPVIRGTKLTTPASAGLTLHGVNAINDMTATSTTNVDDLHAWTKADIVRVPVNECQWLPWSSSYQPTYQQMIVNTVNDITKDGMYAIVDLHYACQDNPSFVSGSSMNPQIGPDQHSVTFWQQAASLFANNPLVMFELFNEPKMNATDVEPDGHTGAQTWLNGGELAYGSAQWQSPGMQALYNTVRATGANNVVLVDGTSWAASLLPAETTPLDGTNIAYAFHAYTNTGENPATYPAHLDTSVGPVISPTGKYREAGIATEFGTTVQDTSSSSPGSAYYTSVANWVAANGAIGWTVWGWYPTGYDSYSLLYWWPLSPNSRGVTVCNLF